MSITCNVVPAQTLARIGLAYVFLQSSRSTSEGTACDAKCRNENPEGCSGDSQGAMIVKQFNAEATPGSEEESLRVFLVSKLFRCSLFVDDFRGRTVRV